MASTPAGAYIHLYVPRKTKLVAQPAPLQLAIHAAVGKSAVPFLRRHLRAAHALLKPTLAELSVALVGDRQMSKLHKRFMNISGPTDVLTFPLDEDESGRALSGEVIICVPEARRRSRSEGTDFQREVLLYGLHGMLHLCGFDDTTPAKFAAMHEKEDSLLAQIGVGPIFMATRDVAGKKVSRRAPEKS